MNRYTFIISFAVAVSASFAFGVPAQTTSADNPLSGYVITTDQRHKTCHASTSLQSINGKGVGFSLHLNRRGKSWQSLAYGQGARPKKRRDTITVQFDGAVFYTRKVRLGRDGTFDFPHRNRRETARFVGKLTSKGNMVILLRDNKDGLVVRLDQMPDVLAALQACADTF